MESNNQDIYSLLKPNTPINYRQIAQLWSVVLGTKIDAHKVVLCMHQMYLSHLIDHPECVDTTVKLAETIFAYEALVNQPD